MNNTRALDDLVPVAAFTFRLINSTQGCHDLAIETRQHSLVLSLTCGEVLDGKAAQLVLIIATIYALFAEDLRLLMGKGVDGPINALTMVVFVLFSAELALTIYINKREKCGCPVR